MLKSTEIVIEQLIIGLLSIVIVNLFVWGTPLPGFISGGGAYQSFFFGVVIVIAAYAAGIIVDRWSDTILEQLERRIRIQVYLSSITYSQYASKIFFLPNEPSVRLEIQKKEGGLADYHDYLRRRMRITRAITCLMPPLFLALALLDYQCDRQAWVRWSVGGGAFCFYASVLVASILVLEKDWKKNKYTVPKTHPPKKLHAALGRFKWRGLSQSNDNSRGDKVRIEFRTRDLLRPVDPAVLGLTLFTLSGMALLVILHFKISPINLFRFRIFLFLGGSLVTCLVGWAWWRICNTFFTLLRNYDEFGRNL